MTALFATLTLAATANAQTPHRTHHDAVRSNLLLIARCETGGKPGQNGRPDWKHQNSEYVGALGFRWSTWNHYRRYIKPIPPRVYRDRNGRIVWKGTREQQLAVASVLVRIFGGYSSWPTCHVRLGLSG